MDEDALTGPGNDQPSFVKAGVTISRLVEVPIREVWPTEYGHFTPWLLANSAALSEAIGLEVQLEAREHPVGAYSLDLIGSEVEQSDRRVIVENQYGMTDHRHLGQLLTYAGGTEPTTIIWIAEDFRDEHRAALDWLNGSTSAEIRFFGLRLTIVAVEGGSSTLVAPQLEVVVRPNDYVAAAKSQAEGHAVGPTSKQEKYREYWTSLASGVGGLGLRTGTPPAENWWNFATGVGGAVWGVNFGKGGAKVELYFGSSDATENLRRFRLLLEHEEAIRAALPDVHFDELPSRKACRVEVVMPGATLDDEDSWPAVRGWMLETLGRLRDAVMAAGGVPV
ncbi:DUF4268 domain-containing protein [Quadrisphaera sp. KR29]|uniref:DUF4268 domain-containing protein n=1 Tax=Quadrisphaera sp. KR29 TaxID=3461391 RepID=UPI004044C846